MWAQISKSRLKPGTDEQVAAMLAQLRAIEQPDSGLIRTLVMRDQKDPATLYLLVLFESEEKARAREQDPRRAEGIGQARAILHEVLDGPPEFIDLDVVEEFTPG
jgi:quinol monooxygenase YgiN